MLDWVAGVIGGELTTKFTFVFFPVEVDFFPEFDYFPEERAPSCFF